VAAERRFLASGVGVEQGTWRESLARFNTLTTLGIPGTRCYTHPKSSPVLASQRTRDEDGLAKRHDEHGGGEAVHA